MKFSRHLTRLVLIVAGLLFVNAFVAATASATTVVQCRIQLSHLRDTEVKAQPVLHSSLGPTGGIAMLDDASVELAEGKNADAVQTLTDFVAQGHFSGGVQDEIGCINAIGTPYNPPISGSGAGS